MARPATIHTKSFDERVADLSKAKARQAEFLPPGDERDTLEREAASDQDRVASERMAVIAGTSIAQLMRIPCQRANVSMSNIK